MQSHSSTPAELGRGAAFLTSAMVRFAAHHSKHVALKTGQALAGVKVGKLYW